MAAVKTSPKPPLDEGDRSGNLPIPPHRRELMQDPNVVAPLFVPLDWEPPDRDGLCALPANLVSPQLVAAVVARRLRTDVGALRGAGFEGYARHLQFTQEALEGIAQRLRGGLEPRP